MNTILFSHNPDPQTLEDKLGCIGFHAANVVGLLELANSLEGEQRENAAESAMCKMMALLDALIRARVEPLSLELRGKWPFYAEKEDEG